MLRAAQAPANRLIVARRRIGAVAGAVGLSLSLSACASGGFSLTKAEVDPSILTSSTNTATARSVDPGQASDELTIRNAVSAADIDSLNGASVPWANAQTGSRGAISSLVEDTKSEGGTCRRFTTSRERFDGVALFRGQVCMVGQGAWQVQSLQPL